MIAGKIDSDNDGYISESEMTKWIKYIQRKYVVTDSRRVWQEYEKLPADTMSWQEYEEKTFSELTGKLSAWVLWTHSPISEFALSSLWSDRGNTLISVLVYVC